MKNIVDKIMEDEQMIIVIKVVVSIVVGVALIIGIFTAISEYDKQNGEQFSGSVKITSKNIEVMSTGSGETRTVNTVYCTTFCSDEYGCFTTSDKQFYREHQENEIINIQWSVGAMDVYILE